jgi:hypothetical protein
MGYRSDVVMQITADGRNTRVMREFIGKIKLAHEEFLGEWNAEEYGWDEDTFVFSVSDIKWYESYPEVKRVEAIWVMAKEMDGLSGKFVRIGEEYDDIETEVFGDHYPDVYVNRSFDFDGSMLGERRTADAQEQTEQVQATIKEGEPTNL